jgi:hypothetical protein
MGFDSPFFYKSFNIYIMSKESALISCRKKFEGLNESERLIEANKFITHVCDKGGTVNMALAFLKEAEVMSGTELMHSVTF